MSGKKLAVNSKHLVGRQLSAVCALEQWLINISLVGRTEININFICNHLIGGVEGVTQVRLGGLLALRR